MTDLGHSKEVPSGHQVFAIEPTPPHERFTVVYEGFSRLVDFFIFSGLLRFFSREDSPPTSIVVNTQDFNDGEYEAIGGEPEEEP